jgi:hypothetical protein
MINFGVFFNKTSIKVAPENRAAGAGGDAVPEWVT